MESSQQALVEARSLIDLKLARDVRINETIKMKDEQINVLTEQNKKLIGSLNQMEEESNFIQVSKISLDEENRALRDSNLDALSKARAAEGTLQRIKEESTDRDRQLSIMTEQNGELLRLLETEESNNARLASECEEQKAQTREYREKIELLERASKEHKDKSNKATFEGHLKAEEARLLKAELESIKNSSSEKQMKYAVEVEALQEHLRVRKEKQYQLLEKFQIQEEARRQAEDQIAGMEEKIRELATERSDAETQLQLEINSKLSQLDANKKLSVDTETLSTENKELTARCQETEQERLLMEAEARDSGEKLREMAEKVFQLLERLKLAELGKNRSMDALRKKEQEVLSLQKKNTHLIKENTKEGKARVKSDFDNKDLEEQIRVIKKHSSQLALKCKEECKLKMKEEGGKKESMEKLKTLNGRISFLLNKIQSDEEAKIVQREETKKMEGQLSKLLKKCEEFQKQIHELEEKNKITSERLRQSKEDLTAANINLNALQKLSDELDEESKRKEKLAEMKNKGKDKDEKSRRLAGGRLRFFVDNKPTLGMVFIKGKCAKDRDWLDGKGCNSFLKRAMKSHSAKEILIQKIAEIYGSMMTEEEKKEEVKNKLHKKEEEIEIFKQNNFNLQKRIDDEEDSKRQTLIRYVNAVKVSVSLGETESKTIREEVGKIGAGKITLPEANMTDEETHAIVASLRGCQTVAELNLRNNRITDDGAHVIASLLADGSSLRMVDLRGNKIGSSGIKSIAESLERSERVRHVYVHAGGKIEALGIFNNEKKTCNKKESTEKLKNDVVKTICVVDIRDNNVIDDSAVITKHMKESLKSKTTINTLHNKTVSDFMNEKSIKKTVERVRKKTNEVNMFLDIKGNKTYI